jgi:hypothetical protein
MIRRLLLALLLIAFAATPAWAAFPQQESLSEGVTASSTSHALTLPVTVSAGATLVACVSANGGITAMDWNTGTTGFTELSDVDQGAHVLSCAYKLNAVGTEGGASITLTSTGTDGTSYWVRSFAGTDPETAPAASTVVQASTTQPDPPSLTAPWGNADNLWIPLAGSANDFSATGYPSNCNSNQQTEENGGSIDVSISSSTCENATATFDPETFQLEGAAASTTAQTLVLKPVTTNTSCSPSRITLLGVACRP